MKLSFSTRGWPELSWDDSLKLAKDMGFSGVEVYNLPKFDPLLDKGGPFHKYNAAATKRQLRALKLSIPCFDTSIDLASDGAAKEKLLSLIDVAESVGVPYVVVCALSDNEEKFIKAVTEILPTAESSGVTVLVKTSGIYSDTARLRALLDRFASDNLKALWDVYHPYRDNGESGDDTIKNLGAYICHVHMRDSDDTGAYRLISEGTMPIDDIMRALASVNYDAFISLEWKPDWLMELRDPEVIFPHFVNFMSRFHSVRDMKKSLYFNHDGKGQYIWKRTSL